MSGEIEPDFAHDSLCINTTFLGTACTHYDILIFPHDLIEHFSETFHFMHVSNDGVACALDFFRMAFHCGWHILEEKTLIACLVLEWQQGTIRWNGPSHIRYAHY